MHVPRWVSAGCALALMVSACGDDTATSTETTVAQQPIDLLYISDSSGRVTAEQYATLIEQQQSAEVRLDDWRQGDQMLSDALARIQRHPDVVAAAEIIVLWGNPWGSGIGPDIGSCMAPSTSKPPPVALTDEYWAPFCEQFETTLAEIWTIRQGAPVVLRVTDMYASNVADWRDAGRLRGVHSVVGGSVRGGEGRGRGAERRVRVDLRRVQQTAARPGPTGDGLPRCRRDPPERCRRNCDGTSAGGRWFRAEHSTLTERGGSRCPCGRPRWATRRPYGQFSQQSNA